MDQKGNKSLKPEIETDTWEQKPAVVNDEESSHMNKDGIAGPAGQGENDSPVKTDGGEVTGTTKPGETKGRKPVSGAS